MLKTCTTLLKFSLKALNAHPKPSTYLAPLQCTRHLTFPTSTSTLSYLSTRAFQTGQNQASANFHQTEASESKSGSNGHKSKNSQSYPDLSTLGLSVSEFKSRIERGHATIDKTDELYRLIINEGAVCATGPRRFGKSLNCSTFESIFTSGLEWWKEYCPNFAITKKGYQFPKHPVLALDFSGTSTLKDIKHQIEDRLWQLLEQNGMLDEDLDRKRERFRSTESSDDLFGFFEIGIWKLATKKKAGVVVLIDEFDFPFTHLAETIWETSSDPQQLSQHPEVKDLVNFMSLFFTVIKNLRKRRDSVPLIRFFYMTGCAPLHKSGLFSEPNEIFFTQRFPKHYSNILGYTEKEIMQTFRKQLNKAAQIRQRSKGTTVFPLPKDTLAEEKKVSKEKLKLIKIERAMAKKDIMQEIKDNYDGFVFNFQQKEPLYSPYAINSLFEEWKLESNMGTYPDFFSSFGSSKLIWELTKSLSREERPKFYWALIDNENEHALLNLSIHARQFYGNQAIKSLSTQIAKLGFTSGLYSINQKTSTSKIWNLKITNKKMKEVYLSELGNTFGLTQNYKTILGYLAKGNFAEYFNLLLPELRKLSAYTSSQFEGKQKYEVELFGHVLFAIIHENLRKFVQENRDTDPNFAYAKIECIKDKAIGVCDQNRPDCVILIDGLVQNRNYKENDTTLEEKTLTDGNYANEQEKTSINQKSIQENLPSPYRKICLNIEFKCLDDLNKALLEAYQDLIKKKDNFKNLRQKYSQLKDCEPIFIAGALGGGVPNRLEFYKLDGETLKLFEEWPQRVKMQVRED